MLERTPTAFVRKTGFVEAVQSDLPCPGWKNFPLCKKARSPGSERDDAIQIFLRLWIASAEPVIGRAFARPVGSR
jgi:hypothetical protein